MTRALLLIDMDAYFASVEQVRRPELVGLPVIVGGSAQSRGVVSTCSYEARACGVRTAMPMAQAQRLCPQAAFLPVDMKAYLAAQAKLLELFGRFTDLVEPVSIDEAFKEDVHGRLGELPVGELSGIGPVTEERLRSLGLTTIARLQDVPPGLLASAFPTGSAALKELAFGGSDDVVRAGHAPPKSMGHEVTFAQDINDPELLQATVLDLADRAASDLRRGGYACRTLTLKLRDAGFHTISGQRTLPAATSATKVIYETASALLCDLHASGCRLRLLGLTLSGLTAEARQLALDDSWRELACDEAVDRVRAKYGTGALRRAGADLAPYRERLRPGQGVRPDRQEPEGP